MISSDGLDGVKQRIRERARADKRVLDDLRDDVRPLRSQVRRINPRAATSVSLVATDGGNNRIEFDPFLFQLVRVVDSYGQELLLDCVSPSTDTGELMQYHFDPQGTPKTELGFMMKDLGLKTLWELSPMIPEPGEANPNPNWVSTYRDLAEWAGLYRMLHGDFGTDTLIVRDGLLRSIVFSSHFFLTLQEKLEAAIERIYREKRRRIFLVGISKGSKVLVRYRLAFALEGILNQSYPCYVEIPRHIEEGAYQKPDYGRYGSEENRVAGKMFMVKFGRNPADPLWPVDIFLPQLEQASQILGYLLADAQNGFPVPFYPRCLQKAHEQAALVDFDMDVLEDIIVASVREALPEREQSAVDRVRLQSDVSRLRYG